MSEMKGYQPIGTAPKDGTPIRIFQVGKKGDEIECYAAVWDSGLDGEHDEHPWRFLDYDEDDGAFLNGWAIASPTHWMPLSSTEALAEVTTLRALVGELVEGLESLDDAANDLCISYSAGTRQVKDFTQASSKAKAMIAKAKEAIK